jgi:phosphoglycerate dehydrogenase-like enzyme
MKLVCLFPPGPTDRDAPPFPEDWDVVMLTHRDQLTDEIIAGTDALVVTYHNPLDRPILERLRGVKLIQQVGVGVDSIDLEAARELGIPVANVPRANDVGVAEFVVMAIVFLLRRIPETQQLLREGTTAAVPGLMQRGCWEARGKKLGIVGFGAIGHEVAVRAAAMGMKLLSADVNEPGRLELGLGVNRLPLEELLTEADVVTLHVPLTELTRNLIGRPELEKMKRASVLVNTSRGGVVDETALADALRSGHLAGAALDVFEEEPLPETSPLWAAPNILLTPHVAGASNDAVAYMVSKSFENVGRVAAGFEPEDRVC